MRAFNHLFHSVLIIACALTTAANGEVITGVAGDSIARAPAGGSVSSSLTVRPNPDPKLVKLSGDINLAAGDIDDVNSIGNILSFGGDFSLESGQAFSLAYDYDVILSGGGSVDLTTTATSTFGGIDEVLTNTETITAEGEYNFTFSSIATVADVAGEGTWTGSFEFDWTDIPAGSTLSIVVPNDSIDFAVVGVPEPGSLGLILTATLGCVARRRR